MHHTQGPTSPSMTGPLQQCQELKPPLYGNNWAHETNRQIFKCCYNQLKFFLHLLIIIWGIQCCYPRNLSNFQMMLLKSSLVTNAFIEGKSASCIDLDGA